MSTKLTKKLLLVFASAALLASCDSSVKATLKEADADAKIILNIDTVPNNKLEVIYDALVKSSSSNSEKVKNNVLYALAESYFGSFYDKDGQVGLNTIVEKTDAEILAWAKSHSPFMTSGEENAVAFVKDFYNHVLDSINETFWNAISNDSYKERYEFDEEKFYKAQVNDLYKLASVATFKKTPLNGSLTKDDVATFYTNYLSTYADYIERSLLPSIYRKALVEQYIYENNYSELGRSYAREVEYISLADNSNNSSATLDLVKSFAKNVIAAGDTNHSDLRNLDLLYKGYFDDINASTNDWARKVYEDAGWTLQEASSDGRAKIAYAESKYGALAKDYSDITTSRWESTGKDFTGDGKYVKEVGLSIKTKEIVSSNNVSEGWFDSSGLSSIPSDIRTRLFKIQVANEVDSINSHKVGDTYVIDKNAKGDFGWYVSGDYYMIPATFPSATEYPWVIHDGSNTYIVKVKEAVKTAKLANPGVNNYDQMKEDGRRPASASSLHEIVTNVLGLKSGSSANEKAAYKHFFEKASLGYHDTDLYNYFVEQFPDLF